MVRRFFQSRAVALRIRPDAGPSSCSTYAHCPRVIGWRTRWWSNFVAPVLVLGIFVTVGCAAATTELDLTTHDPSQDHQKIAAYYSHEAAKLRQAIEDLAVRITMYERLFGPTSDWVTGTRLLSQSYEDAANEMERKAREHMELGNRPRTRSEVPSTPH